MKPKEPAEATTPTGSQHGGKNMKHDYYNIIASAAQVAGRPNASKREVVGILDRIARAAGVSLDSEAVNQAWKRFRQVPVNRVVGF